MYVTVCTRPDIAYGQVAQYCNKPKQSHWTAVQRILAYLKGIWTYGLSYSAESAHHTLMAYSDSDFAGDLDTRRCTTGSIITYSGGAISWMSRRQRCVALSTTEAEYIAISERT